MTTIDGTDHGFRTRVDATATAMVDALAAPGESRCAALHRIVAEAYEISTAAASSPAGAVDGGQGATRPPAPTITDAVLMPMPHVHLDGGPCLFGDRCGR